MRADFGFEQNITVRDTSYDERSALCLRLDFVNVAVARRAVNPSSFSYHHGPVPYWHQQQLANTNANGDSNQPPSFHPTNI